MSDGSAELKGGCLDQQCVVVPVHYVVLLAGASDRCVFFRLTAALARWDDLSDAAERHKQQLVKLQEKVAGTRQVIQSNSAGSMSGCSSIDCSLTQALQAIHHRQQGFGVNKCMGGLGETLGENILDKFQP